MKILTLNVRQWSRDLKCKAPTHWKKRAVKIAELIRRENPDIILFQELTFPMTLFIPREYKRATLFSISHHIYCRREYRVWNREWHLHWCKARITYCPADTAKEIVAVNVFSVHSHWDRKIYTQVAEQLIDEYKKHRPFVTIAGGDWNVDPDTMERRLRPLAICRTHEDTFQNWTKFESHGELDYFAYRNCKPQCWLLDDFVSDHKPVILEI